MKPMGNAKPFVLVIVTVPFLGTVLAIALLWQQAIQWSDLALLATLYTLTAFGLTIGYHRMLTHRSFQPHPAVKAILLVLGSMAVASSPIEFAATHIKHHAQSDREGDPHSPVEGLFHAHLGWLFRDRFADPQVYCRHLLRDAIVVFVNRTFLLWVVLSLGIPSYLVAGPGCCGVAWCAFSSCTTLALASIPSVTPLANASSRPMIAVATSGLWHCWLSEKAGTTIITPFRAQPFMGSTGGS